MLYAILLIALEQTLVTSDNRQSLPDSESKSSLSDNDISNLFGNTSVNLNRVAAAQSTSDQEHAQSTDINQNNIQHQQIPTIPLAILTTHTTSPTHTSQFTPHQNNNDDESDGDLIDDQIDVRENPYNKREHIPTSQKEYYILRCKELVSDVTNKRIIDRLAKATGIRTALDIFKAKESNGDRLLFINDLKDDAQRGMWVGEALKQAVDSESIDDTTFMLEVMHDANLKGFVASEYQAKSRDLLTRHNVKCITHLFPHTLTVRHESESVSPRTQANAKLIDALLKSYGAKEVTQEQSSQIAQQFKETAQQFIQQRQEQTDQKQ